MAPPYPETRESSPEGSPPPATESQVGGSDDGVLITDVIGRKMDEIVHALATLKQSVVELGEDVARIKADAKDIRQKIIEAESKRAARKDYSMGRRRNLIKSALVGGAAISVIALLVGGSCYFAVDQRLRDIFSGKWVEED